jgi:hypothetical protein
MSAIPYCSQCGREFPGRDIWGFSTCLNHSDFVYEIGIRLQLANLLSPVKGLEESINDHLASMGVNQKLVITSVVPLTLKVEREITEKEMNEMTKIIVEQFSETFGKVSIEYVRRQSGNVHQSVS